MNIETAKNIRLVDYLQSIGHTPTKIHGNSAWYLSPLREERTPSFKVNTELNQWYDFALGEGGNIIKLVMMLYDTNSVSEALRLIDGRSATSLSLGKQVYSMPKIEKPSYSNIEIKPLAHPALLGVLSERKISIEIAKEHCKEMYYTYNNKRYFTIAFTNDRGGYATRNSYFKGCITPNGITSSTGMNDCCHLFEGFSDFLSYRTLNPTVKFDYIVLNSVTNLTPSVIEILKGYTKVHCYFDNDNAGKSATTRIEEELGSKVVDHSSEYAQYNDLNEAHVAGVFNIEHKESTKPRSKGIKL